MIRRDRPIRIDWTGWQPSSAIVDELRMYMRRHRRANVGAYLLVVAVAVAGAWKNEQTVQRIQQERVTSIRETCKDTNDRHDTLVARVSPLRGERRAFTLSLIDAATPKRDCEARVRDLAPSRP